MSKYPIFRVEKQGFPDVNYCHIKKEKEGIIALEVGFDTFGCRVIAESYTEENFPELYIQNCEDSNSPEESRVTEISFPAYQDWNIFCAKFIGRTLRVVLIE